MAQPPNGNDDICLKTLRATLHEHLPYLLNESTSAQQQCHSLKTSLQAISQFLLSLDCSESSSSSSSSNVELSQSSVVCWNQNHINTSRKALSMLLQVVGPSEIVRACLLNLVLRLKHNRACLQVVVDFLPFAVEEGNQEAEQEVISCLDALVRERDISFFLPLLSRLHSLSLTEKSQNTIFGIMLMIFSDASQDDLPGLLRTLLMQVKEEEDACLVWEALRCKHEGIKKQQQQEAGTTNRAELYSDSSNDTLLLRTAETILNCFVSSYCLGALLADTFIKSLSRSRFSESPSMATCNELELLLLVILSQRSLFEDPIDNLFDEWLGQGSFPFEALNVVLLLLSSGCDANLEQNYSIRQDESPAFLPCQQRLVPGLLRLVMFLLLAPARQGCLKDETLQSIQSFVFSLHQLLERGKQVELVQSLLQLSAQATAPVPRTSSSGRKRKQSSTITENKSSEASSSLNTVVESVHAILLEIAHTKAESLVCFKHILIDLLKTSDHSTSDKHLEQICSILGALLESSSSENGLNCSELVDLVQHLLFGLSGGLAAATREWKQVVNGILLAKAVLASGKLNAEDRERVKNWVFKVILPSTRRMLQPELGVPCLNFLWNLIKNGSDEQNSSKKSVFEKVKMLLANTGLVQSFSQYKKASKSSEVVIGYRNLPTEFVGTNTKASDMMICVKYFANLNDMKNSERWECITLWAFHLVNTYLENVRHFSQRHLVLGNWVSASTEIAPLKITTNDIASEKAFKSFSSKLNSFELQSEQLVEASVSIDDASKYLREKTFSAESAKQFLQSVMDFQASLLIAVAVSTAILKNAFEESQLKVQLGAFANGAQHHQDTQLLQYQLMKIYDLRSKSESTVDLLKSFAYSVRRNNKKQKYNTKSTETSDDDQLSNSETNSSDLESFGDIAIRAVNSSEMLKAKLFGGEFYVHSEVLWKCIEKEDESFSVQAGVKAFLDSSSDLCPSVVRTMEFKSEVSEHLAWIVATEDCHRRAPKAALLHVVRSISFILDALPVIRTRIRSSKSSQITEAFFSALVRHVISYLRLFFNILVSIDSSIDVTSETRWGCLEWCRDFQELVLEGQDEPVGSRYARGLFFFFSDKLESTEQADVAHCLLELMSFIAVNEGGTLLSEMIEQSWTSLQLVYDYTHIYVSSFFAPYVLSTVQDKPLKKVVESCMKTAVENVSSRPRSAFLQMGLLRHWGLLAYSGAFQGSGLKHLYQLVNDLRLATKRMDASTQRPAPTTQRKTSSTSPSRIKLPMPSIPSLDSQTLPDCFETVASMIVGALAIVNPVSEINSVTKRYGPYQQMKELLKAHRLLVELYQENIVLFSTIKRMSSTVFWFNRIILAATGAQLDQCIQWRNEQPPLEATGQGLYDPGSLPHLRDFFEVVASNTVGMLYSLCGFSVEREGDEYPFKPAKLRPIIGKMEREIKRIAATNNLPPPSFDFKPDCDPVKMVYMSDEEVADGHGKENMASEPTATATNKKLSSEESDTLPSSDRNGSIPLNMFSKSGTNSDDDSFGVRGGEKGVWGESDKDDDDDESTASLDLLQSGAGRNALPCTNGAVKFIKRL